MLLTSKIVGFVGTARPAQAKAFYVRCLGLELIEESDFALVFNAGDTTVRVQKVQTVITPPYTSLGWDVLDIASEVKHLAANGVEFVHFDGLPQDETGIWLAPDGAQVAWFKDPDGNMLSITQR